MWSEFIGREIRVIRATHPGYEGIRGIVEDETKNTLVIRGKKRYVVPKKGCVFAVRFDGKEIKIDGLKIVFRPEDRIRKIR